MCTLYAYTPLLHALGIHIVSTDELTGIQALERKAPTKPLRPGWVERREFSSIRHGTQSAIVNFDVATGRVSEVSLGPTRKEDDFVAHIERTIARDPQAGWIFVLDQLNIHQSLGLIELVARHCGLTDELDQRTAQGQLKAMVNRKMFLSDPTHRDVVQHSGAAGAQTRQLRVD